MFLLFFPAWLVEKLKSHMWLTFILLDSSTLNIFLNTAVRATLWKCQLLSFFGPTPSKGFPAPSREKAVCIVGDKAQCDPVPSAPLVSTFFSLAPRASVQAPPEGLCIYILFAWLTVSQLAVWLAFAFLSAQMSLINSIREAHPDTLFRAAIIFPAHTQCEYFLHVLALLWMTPRCL